MFPPHLPACSLADTPGLFSTAFGSSVRAAAPLRRVREGQDISRSRPAPQGRSSPNN